MRYKNAGPTGDPKCPKCGNSLQNGDVSGSISLKCCATCKHVWQPEIVDDKEKLFQDYKKAVDVLAGLTIEAFEKNPSYLLSPVLREMILEKGKLVQELHSKLNMYLRVDK